MKQNGPGKYDAEVRAAQQATGGAVVALIVLDGKRGSGFSVAMVEGSQTDFLAVMEEFTRQLRAEIGS